MKKINISRNLNQRQKIIILILALVFLFIIIYSVSTLIYRSGKTKTTIRIAPNSASITLNDTHISNNSTIWLTPGKYHLTASFDHLTTYERDIEIKDDPAEIYAILSAADDEGRQYIEQHRQEYAAVEGLIGELTNREGEKLRQANPIIKYLPLNNSLYSISYEYKNNDLVVNVKCEPEFIDTVVAKLKTFDGIDLSSQNIVFNLDNRFTNPQQNPNTDVKKYLKAAFQIPDRYVINDIQQINDYYYTSIYIYDYDRDLSYAHYRVVLKKGSEDAWELVSTPQPLLTIYNTPGVEKDILNTINSY
jgi:hypothetical protein